MKSSVFIKKLDAYHVGPFKSLSIKFNEGINVIIGPNSCGKSTILKTIGMCFATDHKDYRLKAETRMVTHLFYGNTDYLIGLEQNSFSETKTYRGTSLKAWIPPRDIFENKQFIPLMSSHFAKKNDFNYAPHGIGPNRFFE